LDDLPNVANQLAGMVLSDKDVEVAARCCVVRALLPIVKALPPCVVHVSLFMELANGL
jgi:hypothetical protein